MIELKQLSLGFKGKLLLKEASVYFSHERLTALLGRNGSGKSTLLKAICGLKEDFSGDILIDGESISRIPKLKLASKVAYVNTQRPHLPNLKCREVVALGRSPYTKWHGKLSSRDREIVDEALEMMDMQDYSFRNFNTLSDGESQKIMIARAIAQDTAIIILDEPTSFLDLPTRFEVCGLLRQLAHDRRKTIIFSTHELDIAVEMSDYISIFDNQQLSNLPVGEMIKSGHIQKLFPLSGDYISRLFSLWQNP